MDLVPTPEPVNSAPVAEPEATYSGGGLPETPTTDTTADIKANDAELDRIVEGRDGKGRFQKPRHRARSQQATPEDVGQIAEYTKRLRTAEDAIGLKVEQKAGESDRVFQLRRRAEYAEAIAAQRKAEPKPEASKPQLREVPRVEPGQFAEVEPKLEQFADKDDPYAAYLRATAAYDRRKEAFEASEAEKRQSVESATTANNAEIRSWFDTRKKDFGSRLDALIESQPDAVEVFKSTNQMPLTNLMHAALLLDASGEQLMLDLARAYQADPEAVDDLILMTGTHPVNEESVATMQRRLRRMTQAVRTGSAVPQPRMTPAPRPPNPVRTAPQKPADAQPGDDSSLADHAAQWPIEGRRRRR